MYPLWLNIMSSIILLMIPIGIMTIFVSETAGLLILIFAFLGIWIFGNIARRIRITKNIRR